MPAEHAAARALTADFQSRTQALVELPAGEDAELELVEDEPWSAYNYYLGGLRSRVVVNTDVPMQAAFVAELVAHELYPGHHTEHATKEQVLVRERGYGEEAIALVITPQSLVSEAIAEIALEVLLGDEAHHVVADHVRPLGIDYEPERVAPPRGPGRARIGADERGAHAPSAGSEPGGGARVRLALVAPRRAVRRQVARVHRRPDVARYVPCWRGRRLGRQFVGEDPARFRRLLTEQLVPADLAAAS